MVGEFGLAKVVQVSEPSGMWGLYVTDLWDARHGFAGHELVGSMVVFGLVPRA